MRHGFTNWYFIAPSILFVWPVLSGQICEWFAQEGGCLFLMICSLQFRNSVLLLVSLCGTVTLLRAAIGKKTAGSTECVPLGLSAEGTMSTFLNFMCPHTHLDRWQRCKRKSKHLLQSSIRVLHQRCSGSIQTKTASSPLLDLPLFFTVLFVSPLSAQPIPISSWWCDPGVSPASGVTGSYTRNGARAPEQRGTQSTDYQCCGTWMWAVWWGTCKKRSIRQDECSGPAPS